ncbi:MAG: hypothetical protein RSE18_01120 [Acinetobacter sp.]
MNKLIKQPSNTGFECDLNLDFSEDHIYVMQCDDIIKINKKGASELIKVLQEWIDEK